MVADFLLNWIAGVAEWIAGMLPTWNPTDVLPSVVPIAAFLDDLNFFLPVGELFQVTFVVLLLGVPMVLATLTAWVIALIRGGSARA